MAGCSSPCLEVLVFRVAARLYQGFEFLTHSGERVRGEDIPHTWQDKQHPTVLCQCEGILLEATGAAPCTSYYTPVIVMLKLKFH